MGDSGSLIWGVLFGAIGLGFLVYGRRQRAVVPLLSGIGLCIVPYFVSSVFALVSIGALLIALPFFVRVDS